MADASGHRFGGVVWEEVIDREYHLWEEEHIVIDTAGQTLEESKEMLDKMLGI